MQGGNEKLNKFIAKPLPVLEWADIIPLVGRGTMMELGVWQGRSFREICHLAYPRKVYGFDWWRGLPEDWDDHGSKGVLDMHGAPPACPVNGEFVIGLVRGTLPNFVPRHKPAAFVHFDMDVYTSTAEALHYIKFQPGAILVFDEIDGHTRNINHEQKAFREWLEDAPFDLEVIGSRHPESWVIRLLTPEA